MKTSLSHGLRKNILNSFSISLHPLSSRMLNDNCHHNGERNMNRILVSEYNDVPASIQDDGTISGYPLEIGER